MKKTFVLRREHIQWDTYRYNGLMAMCAEFAEKYFGIGTKRKRITITLSRTPIKSGGGKRMYFRGRHVAFKREDLENAFKNDDAHYIFQLAQRILRDLFPLSTFEQKEPDKFYLKIV